MSTIAVCFILYPTFAVMYLVAILRLKRDNIPLPPLTGRMLEGQGFDERLLIAAIFWPIGVTLLLIDFIRDSTESP